MEAIAKKTAVHKPAAKPHVVKKPVVHKPAAKPHVAKPVAAPQAERASLSEAEREHAQAEAVKATAKVPHGKNFYAVGRRKTAVTQALLSAGTGVITINQLPFESYFQTADLQFIVNQPIAQIGMEKQFNIRAKIHGGGIHAQAESMRHAISRALLLVDPESRRTLKKLGFLTRDPRVKERKKPGLKRARRAPQFSKR